MIFSLPAPRAAWAGGEGVLAARGAPVTCGAMQNARYIERQGIVTTALAEGVR